MAAFINQNMVRLAKRPAVVGCAMATACLTCYTVSHSPAQADSSGRWAWTGPGSKKKVVVTGASGMIAQLALPALRERYEVVALDIRASPGVHKCDLLGSREEIRPFFKGAHAVFHSAFVPPPKDVSISTSSFLASNIKGGSADEKEKTQSDGPDRLFAAEHDNVRMAFNVYQTAVEEGVERVVVSSSNHAVRECASDPPFSLPVHAFLTPRLIERVASSFACDSFQRECCTLRRLTGGNQ